jgi:hypothetical protein
VEACTGGRGSVRLDQAVVLGQYRLPLKLVGGSALSTPDWFI